ncbi:M23 family metallopeptidase [Porticoccaceae bacterium]|jgi:murein DD-endopeptidase MepM/ murein hydrolase activator NlpD|nr:M23 family metallopeptidase [Porticoccaceae bacterium]
MNSIGNLLKRIIFIVPITFFYSLDAYAVTFEGEFKQGGLLIGQVQEGQTVIYHGKTLNLTINNQFLLGLGRNAPTTTSITINSQDQEPETITLKIAPRQYNIQKIEGVPAKTVSPPASDLQRIKQDASMVRESRKLVSNKQDFLKGFIKPANGPVTGVYGSQRFYNGVPKSPHYGIDYAAPIGTPVIAPADGVVTFAHNDLFYSGGTLIIDHGHGLSSTFLHLSQILVKPDQQVTLGMEIAKIGATGRATGPHLDWRMNWFDQRIDPDLVLKVLPFQSK